MKSLLSFTALKRVLLLGSGAGAVALVATPAVAAPSLETQYIFNTLSFLMHGFLVMWMAAGFAMLEAGLVRSKNTTAQCLKNVVLYSIAGIMFYVLGYDMLYGGASPFFGGFSFRAFVSVFRPFVLGFVEGYIRPLPLDFPRKLDRGLHLARLRLPVRSAALLLLEIDQEL